MEINIWWEGPYHYHANNIKEFQQSLANRETQAGIYQIYGTHPIYGSKVLLYVGQAKDFSKRIHDDRSFSYNADSGNIDVYLGSLFNMNIETKEEYMKYVSIAEALMIYSTQPAHNIEFVSSEFHKNRIYMENKELFLNTRVMNYNRYRDMLPEISGRRWFSEDMDNPFEDEDYVIYENLSDDL